MQAGGGNHQSKSGKVNLPYPTGQSRDLAGKAASVSGTYAANKGQETVGLRRTNEDKRRAVEAALRHPKAAKLSDRQIAEHVGVSHDMVNRLRKSICHSMTDAPTREVTRN